MKKIRGRVIYISTRNMHIFNLNHAVEVFLLKTKIHTHNLKNNKNHLQIYKICHKSYWIAELTYSIA